MFGVTPPKLVRTIVNNDSIELVYVQHYLLSPAPPPIVFKVVYDIVPGSQKIVDGKYHASYTVPEEYSFDEGN